MRANKYLLTKGVNERMNKNEPRDCSAGVPAAWMGAGVAEESTSCPRPLQVARTDPHTQPWPVSPSQPWLVLGLCLRAAGCL